MPVKSPPRERPLLLMFLAEYENGAWKSATPDWVEERRDGAVAGKRFIETDRVILRHCIAWRFCLPSPRNRSFVQEDSYPGPFL
jgi:hypothetical protein